MSSSSPHRNRLPSDDPRTSPNRSSDLPDVPDEEEDLGEDLFENMAE